MPDGDVAMIAITLKEINARNGKFWRNEEELLKARMADEAVRTTAFEVLADEAMRHVPIRNRKSIYAALAEAERCKQRVVEQLARKGGAASKRDTLQALIEQIAGGHRQITEPELLTHLENRRGIEPIQEIEEGTIYFTTADGRTKGAGNAAAKKIGRQIMEDVINSDKDNPLDAVPQEEILAWCERDRAERYPIMASIVTLFRQDGVKAPLEWDDGAQVLLKLAPDPLAVLKKYVARFRPRSWSGSLAAAMAAPLVPLRTLEGHSDTALAEFATAEGIRLRQEVEAVRRHETEEDKQTDERFE
jgi:hypothetical protein